MATNTDHLQNTFIQKDIHSVNLSLHNVFFYISKNYPRILPTYKL